MWKKLMLPSFTKKIPFSDPDIGDEEVDEVIDTLKSGWLTTGQKVSNFEIDFVNYLGGSVYAVAVNSATAGLHLGLEAVGVGPGDEVITTTHTFTATAEVIRYLGATPVFVDIDDKTFCIDPAKIEAAITKKTKAVIPVHFAGLSADMENILSMAKTHNFFVIEDAAHALPTTHQGKKIGTLDSDVAVFSFYANKTITTGEGGMLVTKNQKIANRARMMQIHGIDRQPFNRYKSETPAWYYQIMAPGFKYNMTDLAASIGIHQLKKVDFFAQKREKIASFYRKRFSRFPIILPPWPKNNDLHSWHLFVIQLSPNAPIDRDKFIEEMFAMGVSCSVHYIPLHHQTYWREAFNLSPKMFPNSEKIYQNCISLPIYNKMSTDDMEYVASSIESVLE